MRCTSCGTENEPDSRFCGGCGAKLAAPAQPRLAPTAKIPDDAVYPPASSLPTGQRPHVGGPASIPPGFNPHAPASIPPTGSRQPTPVPQARHPTPVPQESFSRAVTPAMQTPPPGSLVRPPTSSQPPTQQRSPVRPAASMGESMPMPMPARRPIGLMVAILIIDLGLAAAGAVMLGKGLSAKKARKDTPPAAKSEVKSEATPPPAPAAPAPPAPAPPAPAATASAPPAAAPTMEPASATATTLVGAVKNGTKKEAKPSKAAARNEPTHADTSKVSGGGAGPVTHPSSSPEDPYGTAPQPAFDLAAESNRLASDSGAAFARCAGAAVHGSVKIAYHVMPDGSVEHAMAVENTTGDDAVGDCLATTISSWRYSPHAGQTLSAVRPFTYP